MKKFSFKSILVYIFTLFSLFLTAQTAPDEDTGTDLSCSPEFQNDNSRNVDIANPDNVGTVDDRSCYSDYYEVYNLYGKTWGAYNITDGSNHWDAPNTLQPRIERTLPRSQETGVGSYARFIGTVRILEVGDVSGNGMGGDDGSYLIQAKGKHDTNVNPNGSADPAICLYLAKAVYGTGVNAGKQVAFKIYAERVVSRGGEGIGVGRELVELIEVNKNEEVSFELEVGFRVDPTDPTKKIHYCDAVINGVSFPFEIPEPEIGLESGIRYGAYRVKGGRAQMRWANTTYQKVENPDNGQTVLPGIVEAESGTFGGIVGPSGIGVNNLRGGSANFVQNSVQVTAAGDYDFTFTYNRTGESAASATMEIVSPFETLFTGLSLPQTSGFETVTIEDITLPAGTYDLKFYNANGSGFSLDKYEVTAATKPTITLLGSDPVDVTQGDTYTDAGATALASDGTTDITGNIVVGGDTVDTSTVGTYVITYNVTDGGVAADEVTRTVNVISASTALPGTIEVETGDISNNQTSGGTRNVVGSGNGGTDNIIDEFRKNSGANGTIINEVNVTADGSYDFTFTYFKSSNSNTITINSTNASGENSMTLRSFTLPKNSDTGATTSSYGTHTETGVALTTGINYITITNPQPAAIDLDNVIVTATPADPAITSAATGDWDIGSTWVGGVVPTATDNVIIDDHGITVPVDFAAECTNLTIQGSSNGRFIEVEEGASLNISEDLIVNRSQDGIRLDYSTSLPANKDVGTIIIGGETKSDAATPSGRRALISKQLPSSDDWHLISVGGTDSRQNELARTATMDHNYNIVTNGAGDLFSVGSYNGANAAGSRYEYIPVATYANSVSFDKIGYAVKVENTVTAARSNIRLRPVIEDEDASEDISDAGDSFNLVGNPYLSYIHANTAADPTNNLLTVNSAVLEEQTIWMWNNAKVGGPGWEIFNLGDAALRIHPTQGFFVKAKSGGDVTESFSYTKAMQSHSKAGEYLRTVNNRFEIVLSITNGESSTNTSIRYIDNTSTSFDNGYDSSMFGGSVSELEVYTALVQNNSGEKLAIQSLPNADYENMIIPLGVTAVPNSAITFAAQAFNVPSGYEVYLEDRPNNSFTRMDEAGSDYIATVTELSTEGRFFLHTTPPETLSLDSEFLNSISIYKTNDSNLRIEGLKEGKAVVRLYDLLGKQLLNSNFIANSGVIEFSLPNNLSKGIYVVQLETENGKLNRKVVL